jgi:CheY-like chemotaxis protein
MKSDFLANMSHEIRTPLNGVLGMVEVMAMGRLPDDQKGHLEVIRSSGQALLMVLNDILDFSKIEAGRLELVPAPFEIAEVTLAAQAVFAPLAIEKALTLQVSVTEAASGRRLGDAGRVRQILFNLISNAIKFTEGGGVSVRVDALHGGAGALYIEVADTGVGVPAELVERLFEKFVQGDSSATRRAGGTGLGLAICRELVTLMDGRIELSSAHGLGSVFKVWLPLPWIGAEESDAPADRRAEEAAQEPGDLSLLRVLAADDNAANRQVLSAMLEALGVRVQMVENGREAVDLWQAASPDLILMDIQMPVLDGVAAVAEIRAIEQARALAPTRIIALSANAMRHQVESYLAAGMDGHIAKPLQLEALLQALLEAAAAVRRPAASPRALGAAV